MTRSMICLWVATVLMATGAAHRVSAQTTIGADLDPSRVVLKTVSSREQLRLEYDSIRVGPPAGGLVVSTLGVLGGAALSFAGVFRDFCWCEDSSSRAGMAMIAGGATISIISFAGLVVSTVHLGVRAKRRRAIRAQLRGGALVW